MRVGLNATCLNDSRPSGALQRFVGIYGALIAARPKSEFLVYEPSDCAIARVFAGLPNVTAVRTPVASSGGVVNALAGARYWRARLAADQLDLFECFNLPLVAAPECPTILTIHDIRYTHADVAQPRRAINRIILRRALRAADTVIAVSDTIRDELLTFHPCTAVTTVYNGVDAAAFEDPGAAAIAAARYRFGLNDKFVLAVGHIEPRKNYRTAVAAFALLARRGVDANLVIVGRDGGSRPQIDALIVEQGLAGRVRILDDVDDAALRCLYRACEAVLLTSLYEGFGLTLLEAMAGGRPLVLADIPVFRELTENQGCYFPPTEAEACADRIEALRRDPMMAAALVAYGERRIADFSFPRLAARVHKVYRELAGERG